MKIKKLLLSAASLIVSVALCAAVGVSNPELHAHAFGEYQGPGRGDVNHDGKINLEDAVILQKYMANLYDGFLCWTCADITGSDTPGKCIDLDDVVQIQKYVAKLIDKF